MDLLHNEWFVSIVGGLISSVLGTLLVGGLLNTRSPATSAQGVTVLFRLLMLVMFSATSFYVFFLWPPVVDTVGNLGGLGLLLRITAFLFFEYAMIMLCLFGIDVFDDNSNGPDN